MKMYNKNFRFSSKQLGKKRMGLTSVLSPYGPRKKKVKFPKVKFPKPKKSIAGRSGGTVISARYLKKLLKG